MIGSRILLGRCLQGPLPYVFTALFFAAVLSFDRPSAPLQQAGGCFGGGRVGSTPGGVMVDASGAIQRLEIDQLQRLTRRIADLIEPADGDMAKASPLRKVSLRKLEAALGDHISKGNPVPEEMQFLAGMQKLQYVFVFPEEHDIVLAGFGEGWKIDARGNVVGKTTGAPVLMLDDLLIALRYAEQAAQGGITCSIDPSPEGIERLRKQVALLSTAGDPAQTSRGIEQALGPQMITIGGIPATTRFAHVLVAADYRMKRIGMNFDASGVPGLTSYIQLLGSTNKGMQAIAPRWWLVPNYQPVLSDPDGLAFELRGSSVKCLTEDTVFAANGNKQAAGQSSPAAQRWADMMTTKYEALAQKEPVFAQLQNCMDLAVAGALIFKEKLTTKADYSMPLLLDKRELPNEDMNAVSKTDTIANATKKGSNWVFSASGGVQIDAWGFASKKETSPEVAAVRTKAESKAQRWWWD